jgi:hypothetical protein
MEKRRISSGLAAQLLTFAVGGMLVGTSAGCKSDENKQEHTAAVNVSKHACKGMNACKAQGGCATATHNCAGKNACKGQGGCATVEHHSCKGLNACKGQGGCSTGDNGCAGKNSCKGKGGCAVPVKH